MIQIQQIPQPIKLTADVSVWGTVAVGWLGLLQPWLTAIATILAAVWTGIQIYNWIINRKKK